MAPATQFEISRPPNDAISALEFAPQASSSSSSQPVRFAVSSWDRNVYLYEIPEHDQEQEQEQEQEQDAALVGTFAHRAPVLDVCFGAAGRGEMFSAGMDWTVRRIDIATGEQTVLSKHQKPVRCVVYSPEHSLLISASWDCTLHVHSVTGAADEPPQPPRQQPPLTIPLPQKPHAMAASPSKLVVAMTDRLVHIYDLPTLARALLQHQQESKQQSQPPPPWQQRESSLKFLTRAVACMPGDAGYATSSIEGRVAVEWFEDSAESQARKYAFKCHRQTEEPTTTGGGGGGGDVVFPVNALAFHPIFGSTFASGGGDGTVALWDAAAKRRMRQYQRLPASVAALAFSPDGRYLAFGVCPGFETGMEDYSGEGQTRIYVRELGETEAKGKGAK